MNYIDSIPCIKMNSLKNLFIELTAKNCNQRCKNCYIDFPKNKQIKDFIDINFVKKALEDTMDENIEFIYLTGAEPMTHPDFNTILRTCLKRSNVCICTNGSFINEKKSRFLQKVENESNFSIVFNLPLDHYDELKCDDVRVRGAYRQVLHAIKNLCKYDFKIIINSTNFYEENEEELKSGIISVLSSWEIPAENYEIKINKAYKKESNLQLEVKEKYITDCTDGRILTSSGVFSCQFLANDYRGRVGFHMKDYSKKVYLETDFCSTCLKNKSKMFSII